ncbi:LysR family transcriptional regulator, partial [Burkholderia sp. LMG 13014]|uniref:LysR family transcriptional regulator n=1 Tax=Burkholderia sp. LMG 13014 TaxID=2709306 RepID=UPI001F06978B
MSMTIDPKQAAALLAVADTGSFEQAAVRLHVTASAVTQRVRALEASLGTPLVLRTRPCRPTVAGQRERMVLILDDQLEQDALAREHRRQRWQKPRTEAVGIER